MGRTKKTVKKKQNRKGSDRFKATKGKIALALADLVKAEMQLRSLFPQFEQLSASQRERLWNWMCEDIDGFDSILDDYCELLPLASEWPEPKPPRSKPPTSLGDLPPLTSILGMAAGVFLTRVFSGPLPSGAQPPTAQPPQPPAKTDSIDVEYKRVEPERKRLKKGDE